MPIPARGEAGAPVTILLFSDFQCPYCRGVDGVLDEVEKRHPGRFQVIFKHNPLAIHPQAPLAHEAALEAAEHGKFWEMHDLLFAHQDQLNPENLTEYARRLGLDVEAFRRALESRRHRTAVERDLAEALALGVNATPTLFVNGQRLVGLPSVETLSAAITGGPLETTEAAPPVPAERLNADGAPAVGADAAPVTIVEFSDLQCGFCARASGTMRDLLREYDGRIRWVFKHYPLPLHPDAPLAHEVAMAAGEQGRFWEMHDAIFTSQHAMKRPDLMRIAAGLGLDVARLERDVDSGRFKEAIERDRRDGSQLGVEGTPTFFINGHRLVGAQPAAVFKRLIDRELGGSAAPGAGPTEPRVVVEWFSDLRNPLSREVATQLRQLRARYGSAIAVLFRHRPLEGRAESLLAHEALLAADDQGRFWEMHDLLLVQQSLRSREQVVEHASRLGLDAERFRRDLESGRFRPAIQSDIEEAKARDVRGTPVLYVQGHRLDGVVPLETLHRAVDDALAAVVGAGR